MKSVCLKSESRRDACAIRIWSRRWCRRRNNYNNVQWQHWEIKMCLCADCYEKGRQQILDDPTDEGEEACEWWMKCMSSSAWWISVLTVCCVCVLSVSWWSLFCWMWDYENKEIHTKTSEQMPLIEICCSWMSAEVGNVDAENGQDWAHMTHLLAAHSAEILWRWCVEQSLFSGKWFLLKVWMALVEVKLNTRNEVQRSSDGVTEEGGYGWISG